MASKMSCWSVVLMLSILLGSTIVFFIIGALGPLSTQGVHHPMSLCIVPSSHKIVWDSSKRMIDDEQCKTMGRSVSLNELEKAELYPTENALFYTPIPFLKKNVMSRLFHFLIVDLGINFKTSEYPKKLMKHNLNTFRAEVSLGYRNKISGPWTRLASGNVSRTVSCSPNHMGVTTCDHAHLFELGSCHHKQYMVNLFFPSLPLDNMYKGLSPLARVSLYEVHQSMAFTKLWFVLKSVLCPISIAVLIWFRYRMGTADNSQQRTLQQRLMSFMGYTLVFYNVPFDLLSLYFDCPWLLVFNDFRQGLYVAALFSFWIISVQEHCRKDGETQTSIGTYWKEMGVVLLACTFLFIYEFCERGIQVVFPFYSLWGNWLSISVAWVFIGIASLSALLYLLMFLVATVRAYLELRRKEKELSSLSESARRSYEGLFGQFKFFLFVTVLVAVCSIATVVLPTEMMLHQWQHGKNEYAVYTALLTGNYGMWNAYTLLIMILYAPSKQKAASNGADETDPSKLQKFLSKQSQN
ncbi:protein wntless-like [Halichondria panicea]|uniref:protein wntless-like n=1 Tax=Halichondria panicea TaxID=6063 RepID=UPI00312BAAE1